MFGGHGFFAPNGGMFAAIVSDDEVILKFADETARAELIEEGGHAWTYGGMKKPMTMPSWIVVPESFYDDHEAFSAWARRAHQLVPPKKITNTKKKKVLAPKPKAKPKPKAPVKKKKK